jgi:ABC-2 type transport system permease protein
VTAVPAPPGTGRTLRALVARGLRDGRRAPLSWGVGLGLLCALTAALYPAIDDALRDAISGYPAGLKDALGITEIRTVEDYLDAEVFNLVIPLAIAFFAIRSAAHAITGREEHGELDTVLSAPVRREVLVAGSFIVTAALAVTVLGVAGVLMWLAAAIAGAGLGAGPVIAGLASAWALAMVFSGLATLVAGAVGRTALVTGVAGGTLVAMYVVDAVGKAADELEPLRWASVFRWYGSAVRDGLDVASAAGLTAAGIALAAGGAALFARRDVRG